MKASRHQHELPDNEDIRLQALAILNKLDALGNPNRIYDFLIAKRVKGVRYDTLRSPVGDYVSRMIGGTTVTWVSPMWACVYSNTRSRAEWRVPISLGRLVNVRAFTKGFDEGSYCMLVDNTVDLPYS